MKKGVEPEKTVEPEEPCNRETRSVNGIKRVRGQAKGLKRLATLWSDLRARVGSRRSCYLSRNSCPSIALSSRPDLTYALHPVDEVFSPQCASFTCIYLPGGGLCLNLMSNL